MTLSRSPHVAVIGAGISGLSTAFYLQRLRPDARIALFEGHTRAGGNIRTEARSGFVLDAGPDSFIKTKPAVLELCRELELEGELLGAAAERTVHVAHGGALEPLPEGLILGAPTRLRPLLETPLLSALGKLRMLAELLLPADFGRRWRVEVGGDESITEFLTRRFGAEATQRLVAPMLAGIYAGDASQLSIEATFPMFPNLERRFGSVILGLIQGRIGRPGERASAGLWSRLRAACRWLSAPQEPVAASPFVSFRAGMSALIDALAAKLAPGSLRRGVPVRALEHRSDGRGWKVSTQSSTYFANAVVIATPAHVAAKLVPSEMLADELASLRYASTATVFFGGEQRHLERKGEGYGFVVPPGEGELRAATWVSNKWPGRAPAGSFLIRAFLGGAGSELDVRGSSDRVLLDVARLELERFVGRMGEARITRVYRHLSTNPQPSVGHRLALERVRGILDTMPRLALTGAAYDGVGIPDCIRQGRAVAEKLARAL